MGPWKCQAYSHFQQLNASSLQWSRGTSGSPAAALLCSSLQSSSTPHALGGIRGGPNPAPATDGDNPPQERVQQTDRRHEKGRTEAFYEIRATNLGVVEADIPSCGSYTIKIQVWGFPAAVLPTTLRDSQQVTQPYEPQYSWL